MMIKLIMYGYAQGITSGRALEQACIERLDFRLVTANQAPDHRTISRFRKANLEHYGHLFEQSVAMAADEDLIEMKEVAVDGSKILANASKRKAMSYGRMLDSSKQLRKEIYTLKQEVRIAEGRKKRELSKEICIGASLCDRPSDIHTGNRCWLACGVLVPTEICQLLKC